MTPFDYALALFTILFGLALADVVVSFHRLARSEKPVRWDGRPLLGAALVVVEIVRLWFAQWTIRPLPASVTFPIVGAKFVETLLLVLLALAALPDERKEGVDLTVFHERNRRYFWGLYAAYQGFYAVMWTFVFRSGVFGDVEPIDWLRIFAPLVIYLALAGVRNRVLDYAGPLAVIALYLVVYWPQSLAT